MDRTGRNRWLAFLGLVALVAAIVLIMLALQPARPVEPSGPALDSGIILRRLNPIPEAAYRITENDMMRFPLIGRVLRAYENPACCPEAEFSDTGNLVFMAAEDEAMAVHEYLHSQFRAVSSSAAEYTTIVEHQGRFFEWMTVVT